MYEKFLILDEKKQIRIINAALTVFSEKGYKQASTDDIVSKAEISKGALFHYFGSKEKLYLYLCDYSFTKMTEEFYSKMDINISDFFEKLALSVQVKVKMYSEYPCLFAFIRMVLADTETASRKFISRYMEGIDQKIAQDFFTGFDRTRFKDTLDIDKAVETVRLTADGMVNEWHEKHKSQSGAEMLEELLLITEEYIAFFKKLFYKEEYQ